MGSVPRELPHTEAQVYPRVPAICVAPSVRQICSTLAARAVACAVPSRRARPCEQGFRTTARLFWLRLGRRHTHVAHLPCAICRRHLPIPSRRPARVVRPSSALPRSTLEIAVHTTYRGGVATPDQSAAGKPPCYSTDFKGSQWSPECRLRGRRQSKWTLPCLCTSALITWSALCATMPHTGKQLGSSYAPQGRSDACAHLPTVCTGPV
ncbi:uncharacterized protein C8Q71DRAFT_42236 [Rhodofomes roseus]|uniref:Uncharacterized protein n=1 Tax=Rhodofomes roseus TaxID=34475 RepID=A0ABQ8KZL3_9APHY|nr:uncharacterized protein C8Q71DRAFT_42236 [Rhodofomes roseus]KAH9844373.1 hypothetical protein C8Q71DRAFT_42236 [Rhodofomes roseus]